MSTDPSFAAAAPAALTTTQGRTIIADAVVAKIAGIATREVEGVYDVGGGTARAVGALRDRIPGARVNHSQGVAVEVGEKQTAIDIGIVAEYGVALHELAAAIRRNVISAVEGMTGLEVTEVDITVYDVILFDETEQGLRVTGQNSRSTGQAALSGEGTDVRRRVQ